jgi:hypothetical protein
MGGILQVDTIQNNNTSNLITQTNSTTITIGTTGQTVSLASGSSSSGFGEVYNGAVNWTSTLVTSSLTVSAGVGYFVNTSTAAITITLPSTPTFGNIVGIVDYSGYASTNNITVNPNGNKLEGGTLNKLISTNKESVILNYVDSTRGWLPTSGVNNGTDALSPSPISVDYLVIAGGAGGGKHQAGGGGAGGFRSTVTNTGGGGSLETALTILLATNYTVTVGAGGAGTSTSNTKGTSGSNSVFSTITSTGGGGGSYYNGGAGLNGGSGGGGGGANGAGGTGTANQGFNGGQGNAGADGGGGGGGGAGQVGAAAVTSTGGNGGNGVATSITGSSVTYAGGGGGGGTTAGNGGNGGGGNGTYGGTAGSGTANTGSGGGGEAQSAGTSGGGGSGIVILKYVDTFTITNPGGGLTFSTPAAAGGFKVTSFTAGTGTIQFN